MIRDVDPNRDAEAIAAIYNYYIRETTVSFETEPLSAAEMRARILHYTQGYPWLVTEEAGRVAAYAYATKFRERPAYRHTCEVSVYCDREQVGRGHGGRLLAALLERLRALPEYYTAVAVITGGNQHSVDVFRRLGFAYGGTIRNAGYKLGQWLDTYDYVYALKEYDTIGGG